MRRASSQIVLSEIKHKDEPKDIFFKTDSPGK